MPEYEPIIVDFIDRAGWGAKPPKAIYPFDPDPRTPGIEPASEIFIHHLVTATDPEIPILRAVQDYHMNGGHLKPMSDIAYNIAFGQSGKVYEGRGWDREGGGTGYPYDDYTYSFVFIGNSENDEPSEACLNSMAKMIAIGMIFGRIRWDAKIRGDRNVNSTACPGARLYRYVANGGLLRRAKAFIVEKKETPVAKNLLGNWDDWGKHTPGTAMLTGWAANPDIPDARVGIRVYADGVKQFTVTANKPRRDVQEHLANAGISTDALHGFEILLEMDGPAEVRLEVIHDGKTLDLGTKRVTPGIVIPFPDPPTVPEPTTIPLTPVNVDIGITPPEPTVIDVDTRDDLNEIIRRVEQIRSRLGL